MTAALAMAAAFAPAWALIIPKDGPSSFQLLDHDGKCLAIVVRSAAAGVEGDWWRWMIVDDQAVRSPAMWQTPIPAMRSAETYLTAAGRLAP